MIFKLFGIDDDYLNDYMCSVEKRGLGQFQPPPPTGPNPPLARSGRLFLTSNWLMFHSPLGVKISLPLRQIVAVEKKVSGRFLSTPVLNVTSAEKIMVRHLTSAQLL